VGDVDWVHLAPDRKVWKAPLHTENYLMMFVIEALHNINVVGSMKLKEIGHVVCM